MMRRRVNPWWTGAQLRCKVLDMEGYVPRSSLPPIRSLLRGLDVLHRLNIHDGVSIMQVARELKLPRTTVLRLLETLALAGYAVRDPVDERYRATVMVRRLADGFGDTAWIRDVARPVLDALGRELLWPLAVSTPVGLSMVARVTTDRASPLAVERFSPGESLNLLSSCSGLTYLSFCDHEERRPLLELLGRAGADSAAPAGLPEGLEEMLADIRVKGYGTYDYASIRRAMVAVPILTNEGPVACLALRYVTGGVPADDVRDRYVPKMQAAARQIAMELIERAA